MKKKNDAIKDKLFELADMLLDNALEPDAPAALRMEALKHVSALYLGNVRATKNLPPSEDDDAVTFDKLRERINAIREDE